MINKTVATVLWIHLRNNATDNTTLGRHGCFIYDCSAGSIRQEKELLLGFYYRYPFVTLFLVPFHSRYFSWPLPVRFFVVLDTHTMLLRRPRFVVVVVLFIHWLSRRGLWEMTVALWDRSVRRAGNVTN